MKSGANFMRYSKESNGICPFRAALLVLLLLCLTCLAPSHAQAQERSLSPREADLVQIYTYRATVELNQERRRSAVASARLTAQVNQAEQRYQQARQAKLMAERTAATQSARIVQIEAELERSREDFAKASEAYLADIAKKDAEFAALLSTAASVGANLLETEAGREALELIGAGGTDNIRQGLELLDAELERQETIDQLRRTERFRSAAFTHLGLIGNGSTIRQTIELYERLTGIGRANSQDWLTLASLYRQANRLEESVSAAQQSLAAADSDYLRALAKFDEASSRMLMLNDGEAVLSGERFTVMVNELRSNRGSLRVAPLEQRQRLYEAAMVELMAALRNHAPSGNFDEISEILSQARNFAERDRTRRGTRQQRHLIGRIHVLEGQIGWSRVVAQQVLVSTEQASAQLGSIMISDDWNIEGLDERTIARMVTSSFRSSVEGVSILGELAEGVDEPDLELDFVEAARSYLDRGSQTAEGAQMNLPIMLSLLGGVNELIGRYPQSPRANRELAYLLLAIEQARLRAGETADMAGVLQRVMAVSQRLLIADPSSADNALLAANLMQASLDSGASGVELIDVVSAFDDLNRRRLLPPIYLANLTMLKMRLAIGGLGQ